MLRWIAVASAFLLASFFMHSARAQPSANAPAPASPTRPAQAVDGASTGKKPVIVVLAVSLNGVEQPDLTEAWQIADDDFAIPLADLAKWRLTVAPTDSITLDGISYARLSTLAGINWRIDKRTQTLIVTAKANAFAAREVSVADEGFPQVTPSPPGAFFNYDVQSERTLGQQTYSGLYQLAAFGKWGTVSSSGLYRSESPTANNVRLDTTWTIDLPEKRQSIWIGDAISESGTWGRSVRFGGVRWGTNFGLTPSFSTVPLPTVRGETALPSTLDLFINNNYSAQTNVPAGPFDLTNVPLVTGKGEIRMAVRDVLGREQIITQPYYTSNALLKSGLHDFSVEAGAIREDYSFESNNYGRSFVAGTDRVGVTPSFTRELRGEFLSSQQTVGAGGTWLIGTAGTVGGNIAASRADAGNGWSTGVNFERQAENFSGNLIASYASRYFTQLGELEGRNTKVTFAAAIGIPWRGGGIGASYVYQSTWQEERNRLVTLSYSRSIGSKSFLAIAASRQLDNDGGTSVSVTLIHTLGTEHSVSAIAAHDAGETYTSLQLQKNLPAGPGYGYQVNVDQNSGRHINAIGSAQNEYTRINGAFSQGDGGNAYRIGAAGSVAMMDGQMFATRQIDDSFAVVKVGDYADVNVLRDNQPVTRTGNSGYAFVTGLRGYDRNRISVDQADLPFDAEIDRLDINVTPAMRSGVVVDFPVRRMRSATARLIDESGKPIGPGTPVTLIEEAKRSAVGYDGKIFVSSTGRHVRLLVQDAEGSCRAEVTLADSPESVPNLGNVVCHRGAQ